MDDNADAGEFLCVIDDEGNKFQVCKGRVLYGFVIVSWSWNRRWVEDVWERQKQYSLNSMSCCKSCEHMMKIWLYYSNEYENSI